MSDNDRAIFIAVLVVIGIVLSVIFTPIGRFIWNKNEYAVQKIDDATSYATKKEVEDTCRSMIASYASDKMIFEQYWNSISESKKDWADQAKMRANKTAATYNEYILKNSYVWKENVPSDIYEKMEYIE